MVVAMMSDSRAAEMFEPEIAIDCALAWGLGFGLTDKVFWQWGDSGDFQSVVVGSRESSAPSYA